MEKFEKPAQSSEFLVAQLIERKLEITEILAAQHFLDHIGYYRFTGYMQPFLARNNTQNFKEGATFQAVLDHYLFDKKLRLIILDVIEVIEVSVRTIIGNTMALPHGPHWYLNEGFFRNGDRHQEFLEDIRDYCSDCHESFIKHYVNTYSEPSLPPIWMIIQTLTFGQISRLYDNLKASSERSKIAYQYGVTPVLFESWLKSINFIRNCCAHHSRIWNRPIPLKPAVPTSDKFRFLKNVTEDTDKKLYGALSCMLFMLSKINTTSTCKTNLKNLFKEFPHVNIAEMGFPKDYEDDFIWTD